MLSTLVVALIAVAAVPILVLKLRPKKPVSAYSRWRHALDRRK